MFGMRCIEHPFDDILVEYCTSPLYSRYDDLLFQYGSNRRPSDIRPAISAYFERPPHVFFLFLRKVLSHESYTDNFDQGYAYVSSSAERRTT